jgi:hypothetical protein
MNAYLLLSDVKIVHLINGIQDMMKKNMLNILVKLLISYNKEFLILVFYKIKFQNHIFILICTKILFRTLTLMYNILIKNQDLDLLKLVIKVFLFSQNLNLDIGQIVISLQKNVYLLLNQKLKEKIYLNI